MDESESEGDQDQGDEGHRTCSFSVRVERGEVLVDADGMEGVQGRRT